MAMIALGVAEEYRVHGVAGNTPWPRTNTDTAAHGPAPGYSSMAPRLGNDPQF